MGEAMEDTIRFNTSSHKLSGLTTSSQVVLKYCDGLIVMLIVIATPIVLELVQTLEEIARSWSKESERVPDGVATSRVVA
jgi:hypothetical protein